MAAALGVVATTFLLATSSCTASPLQKQPALATRDTSSPQQAVSVTPLSFAVWGDNGSWRSDVNTELFNPTNASPPFFQVFDSAFLDILGPSATIREIASNPTFAVDIDHNNQISSINLSEVTAAINAAGGSTASVNVSVTKLDLPDTIQMTNGGTGPYSGNLVLANSGRGSLPPSIALVNPAPPHNTTVLLDNFFGRQFNSLNDVKIRPGTNKLFFTDVVYGFLNHFRGQPLLPNQVYRLDPDTRAVRVVADGFVRCNGIAFSSDGSTAFVTDTGFNDGFFGNNQTLPATIYAFDVDPKTEAFKNRRVFAYVDTGIPDGIQVDAAGNVYAGCADGIQVWGPDGTLLGKFFLGTTAANLVFAGDNRLVILAETSIYYAEIAAKANKLAYP
ncbi:D-lactonohydrolase-like protein [Trametes elegans]|nr:D-lactonohydrolase-like protein [Trametes elegans]